MGIPVSAFTERLMEMGVHNTLDELIEAQRTAQYNRLAGSPTGRAILDSLHISYADQHGPKILLDDDFRANLSVAPLPKNMHPEHHQERRLARAMALHKQYHSNSEVCYVDAADYHRRRAAVAVVVNQQGNTVASCSITEGNPEIGEEVAIALAIAGTSATIIISDSKTALRNYARGRISTIAAKIIQSKPIIPSRHIRLVWTPAHSSLPGNEMAHEAARGFCYQADFENDNVPSSTGGRDRLVTYREITQHYRLGRRKLPAAHRTLNRRQSVAWRRIQSNTFPHPALCHRNFPDTYTGQCRWCGAAAATLPHMVWACPSKPQTHTSGVQIVRQEQWEAALLSSQPDIQTAVVQLAEDAARAHGFLTAV